MGSKQSLTEELLANASRRDERANVEMAERIVAGNDVAAVAEVVANLGDKKLQSDCVKILYEIAEKKPALAADYVEVFIELLDHKNNRLIWGAMAAIDGIASLCIDLLYANLDKLLAAAKKGSVITRDHLVNILVKLAPTKEGILPLLLDQLATSPVNQMPMYAERSAAVFMGEHRGEFVQILNHRFAEMNTAAKKARINRVLRRLS